MTTTTYYELRRPISYPGSHAEFRPGHRMTKEQWMAAAPFSDGDFERFSGWFFEHEYPEPEIDVCAEVVMEALGIGSCNTRNALNETLAYLVREENSATDVTKAYGLRIARDYLSRLIEQKRDPTPIEVKQRVASIWREKYQR